MMQSLPENERKAFNQIQQAAQRAKEEEIRLWWLDRMVRTQAAAGRKNDAVLARAVCEFVDDGEADLSAVQAESAVPARMRRGITAC